MVQVLMKHFSRRRETPTPAYPLIDVVLTGSEPLEPSAYPVECIASIAEQAKQLAALVKIQERTIVGGEASPEELVASVASMLGARHATLHLLRHRRLAFEPVVSTRMGQDGESALPTDLTIRHPELLEPGSARALQLRGGSVLLQLVSSPAGSVTNWLIEVEAREGQTFSPSDSALLAHVAPCAEVALRAQHRRVFDEPRASQSQTDMSQSAPLLRRPPRTTRSAAEAAAVPDPSAANPSARELLEMVKGLTRLSSTSEPLFQQIRSAAKQAVGADKCTVFLMSDDRQQLIGTKSEAEGGDMFVCPANLGLAGYVAQTGCPLSLSDAHADERFNAEMDRSTGYRTRQVEIGWEGLMGKGEGRG